MSGLNHGHGVIATLVRGKRLRVVHFPSENGTDDAIDDVVRYCDRGGWKIRTLSNPSTIIADLRGRATDETKSAPEPKMLARRGRLDLLEHRLAVVMTGPPGHRDPHRRRWGQRRV